MTSARRRVVAGVVLVAALAGCTTTSGDRPTSSSGAGTAPCGGADLDLVTEGRLTVATYDPVFAPWFVSNDPGNGQGFESALAFQAAKRMGFEPQQVRWVRMPLEKILKPKTSSYDLAFAEVSITEARRTTVDFSAPYASTHQAVVTYADSPIADASTLNDLRDAKLGASVQTTSLSTIDQVVKPKQKASSFPTIAAAAKALDERTIDGVVVDEPTAEYLAGSRLKQGRVLGMLPGTEQQIGAVLPKRSALTSCVNKALGQLRDSRRLADLRKEWLPPLDSVVMLRSGDPSAPADRTSPRSSGRRDGPSGKPAATTGGHDPSPTK